MMSINQADSASMRKGTFPKNDVPEISVSSGFPVKAWRAGIDVATATNKTKMKLLIALVRDGRSGIRINPIPVIIADDMISWTLSIIYLEFWYRFFLEYVD